MRKQLCQFEYEIIVVDNESDDDSVATAIAEGARVVVLKRNDFSFGHSLNYGIEHCRGAFILILSAHVLLLSEHFLQNIPDYFKDVSVAGLRFVNSIDVSQLSIAAGEGAKKIYYNGETDFALQHWKHLLVNHCAAIRRSCWVEQAYDARIFASEDKIWSLAVLKKGYSLQYQVPLYYAYIKQLSGDARIKRMALETAAKEMITGKTDDADPVYFASFRSGIKKMYSELSVKRKVSKMVEAIKARYGGADT